MASSLDAFPLRRRAQILLTISLISVLLSFLALWKSPLTPRKFNAPASQKPLPPTILKTKLRQAKGSKFDAHAPSISCLGPRKAPPGEVHPDDELQAQFALPSLRYPRPTIGSYETLGLEETWMTVDQRYGPYGYGEEKADYGFAKVDWQSVNWGKLQNECFAANSERFDGTNEAAYQFSNKPRFRLLADSPKIVPPASRTGRTAFILRTWSTYKYEPEDMWNVRAIINEASLRTGGEYAVVLLVDVKDEEKGPLIHTDDNVYKEVLEASVPAEFRDIAVLFHNTLQKSWYERVQEYAAFWQIMQPLQLFAHFYPEFDHFWQFEMDTRFTGDVGKMLRAYHTFSQKQPYKQARERASWAYIPQLHGTFEEFSSEINKTLEGGADLWGPVEIKNFKPIGVPPPKTPKEDDFKFGVGMDADLLLPSVLNDGKRFGDNDWVFKNNYENGFDPDVPRWMSVPAQARASYDLLDAVHNIQHEQGLKTPGEGTLPSYAIWLGLKVVGLPHPMFQYPERNIHELNAALNGGYPDRFKDGIADGPGRYRSWMYFFTRPMTWDWTSALCDPIFQHWMGQPIPEHPARPDPGWPLSPRELPWFMAEHEGKVYAPGFIMHPRKTNP